MYIDIDLCTNKKKEIYIYVTLQRASCARTPYMHYDTWLMRFSLVYVLLIQVHDGMLALHRVVGQLAGPPQELQGPQQIAWSCIPRERRPFWLP